MSQSDIDKLIDECAQRDPEAALERALLEEYLQSQGYSLKELANLPTERASALMKEACEFASLRLAQVESTALFREKIRGPSSSH
jgi:hypothetical protein